MVRGARRRVAATERRAGEKDQPLERRREPNSSSTPAARRKKLPASYPLTSTYRLFALPMTTGGARAGGPGCAAEAAHVHSSAPLVVDRSTPNLLSRSPACPSSFQGALSTVRPDSDSVAAAPDPHRVQYEYSTGRPHGSLAGLKAVTQAAARVRVRAPPWTHTAGEHTSSRSSTCASVSPHRRRPRRRGAGGSRSGTRLCLRMLVLVLVAAGVSEHGPGECGMRTWIRKAACSVCAWGSCVVVAITRRCPLPLPFPSPSLPNADSVVRAGQGQRCVVRNVWAHAGSADAYICVGAQQHIIDYRLGCDHTSAPRPSHSDVFGLKLGLSSSRESHRPASAHCSSRITDRARISEVTSTYGCRLSAVGRRAQDSRNAIAICRAGAPGDLGLAH